MYKCNTFTESHDLFESHLELFQIYDSYISICIILLESQIKMHHLYKRVGVTDGWYELWYEGLQLGFQVHCLGGVAQDVGKQGPAIICTVRY